MNNLWFVLQDQLKTVAYPVYITETARTFEVFFTTLLSGTSPRESPTLRSPAGIVLPRTTLESVVGVVAVSREACLHHPQLKSSIETTRRGLPLRILL